MTDLERLALTLHDIEAVKFGRFQLASGKTSPIYVDLRLLISDPQALAMAAKLYAKLLHDLQFDLLGAIPYGGLPIGVAIALEIDNPLIFPRKTTKSYGTGKAIEGKYQVGQQVVIIEDLVTTGGSALEGVAMLKAAGLQVSDIVVLLDRLQGADQIIADAGYKLHSVIKLDALLVALEQHGRISSKQRDEVMKALKV